MSGVDLFHVDKQRFADENDFLRLVSAQIVLKVLNDSIKVLEKSSKSSTDQQEAAAHKSAIPNSTTNENYVNMRKHLNIKRWHCVSRPQYKFSCGISSLVSCWNYLYSTLGYGKLKPLSQEEALRILGYEPPFDQIRFGPFTGNKTLMKWFKVLNKHFKVSGRPSFFYKPVEPNRTLGVTSQLALERLQTLLKSKHHAFIYHCYNHYFCPVGFEREPASQEHIFYSSSSTLSSSSSSSTTTIKPTNNDQFIEWVLVAETSRKYPAFHCFKWDDIERDLSSRSPEYVNIRKLDRGIQKRGTKTTQTTTNTSTVLIVEDNNKEGGEEKIETSNTPENVVVKAERPPRVRRDGGNLHCLMMFQRFDSPSWQIPEPTTSSDSNNDYLNNDDDDSEDSEDDSTAAGGGDISD